MHGSICSLYLYSRLSSFESKSYFFFFSVSTCFSRSWMAIPTSTRIISWASLSCINRSRRFFWICKSVQILVSTRISVFLFPSLLVRSVSKCWTRIVPYAMTWDRIVTRYHKRYTWELGVSPSIETCIQSQRRHWKQYPSNIIEELRVGEAVGERVLRAKARVETGR